METKELKLKSEYQLDCEQINKEFNLLRGEIINTAQAGKLTRHELNHCLTQLEEDKNQKIRGLVSNEPFRLLNFFKEP